MAINPNEERIKKLLELQKMNMGKPEREEIIMPQEIQNLKIDFGADEEKAWGKYFGISFGVRQGMNLTKLKQDEESPF